MYQKNPQIKKTLVILCAVTLILGLSGMAGATTYTFDVGLLEHDYYYTYGIDWELPEGEVIEGFSLSFDQIANWDDAPNVFYIHLLEGAPAGLTTGLEDTALVDDNYFDYYTDTNIHLVTWNNLSSTPQDLTYNFDSFEVATLITYLADENFGFGFDPDCGFPNNGCTCKCGTTPIPEPATMLLLGTGLIGLAGFSSKRFKK